MSFPLLRPRNEAPDVDVEESIAESTKGSTGMKNFYGDFMTAEEAAEMEKIERRAKLKVDLLILPLLSSVFFLAQIV